MHNYPFLKMKKNIIIIFLILMQGLVLSQNIGLHINPGDFSNSKFITTIFKDKPVLIDMFPESDLDTVSITVKNGELIDQTNKWFRIKPDTSGPTTIYIEAIFKNGDSINLTKKYSTIDYPEIELKLLSDSLNESGYIEFELSSRLLDAKNNFSIGYFEFEVLSPDNKKVFGGWQTKSLKIKIDKSVISPKNKLIIKPIRLLWEEYNLTVFSTTKTFSFKK